MDKDGQGSFSKKNLGVIVTSIVSVAAVLVSAAQVWVAHINKQKEIEITKKNQRQQQETLTQEKERKWKLDMAEFVVENEDRIFSEEKDMRSRIRDIMIVTFPPEFTKIVFAKLAKLEKAEIGAEEQGTATEKAKIATWLQGKERIDEVVTEEAKTIIASSGDLFEKLKGEKRKLFSDKLAELYQKDKNEVLEVLINSILPEADYWSYRVNIYIALTLEKIASVWKGTKAQLETLQQLRQTRNYKDATFRKRVEGAISNYKGEIAALKTE